MTDSAKQDMIEMRALFVERLATVDQRHPSSLKERDRIRGEITRTIKLIDAGFDIPGLVGAVAERPNPMEDTYHGDF